MKLAEALVGRDPHGHALEPLVLFRLGRGGALDARTSPFGRTYSQRGCSSPAAKAATVVPGAAVGVRSAGQPFAGAMCTVGMRVGFGGGSAGSGPTPAENGSFADSQPATMTAATSASDSRSRGHMVVARESGNDRATGDACKFAKIRRPPCISVTLCVLGTGSSSAVRPLHELGKHAHPVVRHSGESALGTAEWHHVRDAVRGDRIA